MKRDDDIVTRIVAHGIEQGLWSADTGRLIDEQLRAEFGGERHYVPRVSWSNISERDRAVRDDLANGVSVRAVAEKFCIGVATVQRIRDAA